MENKKTYKIEIYHRLFGNDDGLYKYTHSETFLFKDKAVEYFKNTYIYDSDDKYEYVKNLYEVIDIDKYKIGRELYDNITYLRKMKIERFLNENGNRDDR